MAQTPGAANYFTLHGLSGAMARLWTITSSMDAGVASRSWYLTDHQQDVDYYDGSSYTTFRAGTIIETGTMRKQSQLRENGHQLTIRPGTDYTPTASEIRAGILDDAQVTEQWIDWTHPMHGPIIANRWYVADVGEGRTAAVLDMRGISSRFARTCGDGLRRDCRNRFSDDLCDYGTSVSGTAAFGFLSYEVELFPTGNTRRSIRIREKTDTFPAAALTAADWWAHGELRLIDGDQKGITVMVESNDQPVYHAPFSGYIVDIYLATPLTFAPESGQEVEMRVGCNKSKATCQAKFNNFDNFRADPSIPGSDAKQKTPAST